MTCGVTGQNNSHQDTWALQAKSLKDKREKQPTNFYINLKAVLRINHALHTSAHLQANNQSFYQLKETASIYSPSDLRYVKAKKNATVGVSLQSSLQVSHTGMPWREPGGAPDSWLFLKRISEADYCLNPFFHRVPTNCHFSFGFTIANKNSDRQGNPREEIAYSRSTHTNFFPHVLQNVFSISSAFVLL